jgi:hypothetical protein
MISICSIGTSKSSFALVIRIVTKPPNLYKFKYGYPRLTR